MRPIVIGLGNPGRGDDAAGRLAARALAPLLADVAEVVEARGETTEILTLLEGRDDVVLIDACVSGARAGTTYELDMQTDAPPRKGGEMSSHGLGLAEAIALARALGALPARCMIYAIEGARFEHGAPLSEEVAIAVDRLVQTLSRARCAKP